MQTANVLVAIGGDTGNTVPKYGVTAAEVAVLRFLHGEQAVFDIELVGEVTRTHRQEIARLAERYGRQEGERRISPAVEALYPGAAARVFETFEELEIPDDFYKAIARHSATSTPAPSKPKVDLKGMTVNELRARADKEGVDLSGITKKADIIEALETTAAARAAETAAAGNEDEDDGVGDMNDEFADNSTDDNLFQ